MAKVFEENQEALRNILDLEVHTVLAYFSSTLYSIVICHLFPWFSMKVKKVGENSDRNNL